MDCAKAVGVRIARPKTHLSKLGGILKVHSKLPLLIAIPTTAGTGSETTLAAVIVDATTRHKYAINDFPLIPRYAVLDPKVTLTLPASITATTGMDALTHAVEAYISRSFFADSSYMLSFSVLCSCVCSRLISPSVSSWHKQDNTLMHQSPGHIQRRTPYNF